MDSGIREKMIRMNNGIREKMIIKNKMDTSIRDIMIK